MSLFGSPGHLDLAESAWGNRMRAWKPERKVKLKQRESTENKVSLVFIFTQGLPMS